jgi:hypothetical protein
MDPINAEPPQVNKSFHSPSPSPPHGEDFTALASDNSSDFTDNNSDCMSIICANDLVDLMFLMDPWEGGQCHHARIVEFVQYHEHDLKLSDDHHKFSIFVNDDEYEENIIYNKLMDFIKKNKENEDVVWKFKHIASPLICTDPNYKGSKYNVLMEWENWVITKEPLAIIAADDHIACAIYAKEKGLLDKDRWKDFKKIAY